MLKMIFIYGISFWAALSGNDSDQFRRLAGRISDLNNAGNTNALLMISDSLHRALNLHHSDTASLAEIYYYSGVCNLLAQKQENALVDLNNCIYAKRQVGIMDENYAKALFNAGLSCYQQGDFIQSISFMKDYENLAISRYGEYSGNLAEAYSVLAGASIEYIDYEGFVDYAFKALNIIGRNKDALDGNQLSNLYSTIGVGYIRMADFAKAKLYLEKSESLIKEFNIPHDANYINLINSLAYTYGVLGLHDEEKAYFKKGIDLAVNNTSSLAFNLIHSYAIDIGKAGNVDKGEALLSEVVNKAQNVYGTDSRFYMEVLNNYAKYLVLFRYKTGNALEIYKALLVYVSEHQNDLSLRMEVLLGFARALHETGNSENALRIIHDLLFQSTSVEPADLFSNPAPDIVPADRSSLRIIQFKHEILKSLYQKTQNRDILIASAETSELIVALIGEIRLNISEEESRLILGDRYRDSYLLAIHDFEQCYRITGERRFLEKAFEFAERSKVAGLLAATRQMKAVEFHIPQNLAEREKLFQNEIGFYNSRISAENEKEKPDQTLLAQWTENLLLKVAARDSLVLTFERDFPDYFTLKYNTKVPLMKEVSSITGRSHTYINYVVADSVLYVFLINRKYQELITIKTDSSFIKNLADFRSLLSDPSQSEDARKKFESFQSIGYDLFKILIEPVKQFLISDNLLISPDNILSYLPFETFLTSKYAGNDILYRKLKYLMNDYNISYAYSATFMRETVNRDIPERNRLVAFAPSYPLYLNLDSLLTERQAGYTIKDIPFARQEAEYVAGTTHGSLYLNYEANESEYKSEASKYNLIHLAMHTVVNDQNPMNSAMVFAQVKDSVNDGLLYTYEVYGIPLKAKMVVLSSCNTGSGTLSSGEGILSLARGFLYSGSESVVMSLWKIEDRSGTDIVKKFYDNLRKGMSKSKALRKARYGYLKKASQLKSHPYFWSTLVIFGDNAPVFFPWKMIAGSGLVIILAAILLFLYLWKRR
ncbi:MAG: CHAT domain-containing protein [Bacteroidales bacterium]|nr:CHAT domain-containing protein [Bacteroidales bacterium]